MSDTIENQPAGSARVDAGVIREFWVIQERFRVVKSAWRDVSPDKQPLTLRWDRRDASVRLAALRASPHTGMVYRIVHRRQLDEPTDL